MTGEGPNFQRWGWVEEGGELKSTISVLVRLMSNREARQKEWRASSCRCRPCGVVLRRARSSAYNRQATVRPARAGAVGSAASIRGDIRSI